MANLLPDVFEARISTHKGFILIWKIAYPIYDRRTRLNRLTQRNEVVRKLQTIGYDIQELQYKASGQPFLPDSSEYISISHSQNWFAIYLSSEPVGVDIEVERTSIADGKEWFLNDQESNCYHNLESLHLIWGAKEAFYKKIEGQIHNLRTDTSVKHIHANQIVLTHKGQDTLLSHRKIEQAYIVWTEVIE